VQGLLRTARLEDATKTYTLLDLPQNWAENPGLVVSHILDVLERTRISKDDGLASADWEYAFADSILHVPRVYPARDRSKDEPEVEVLLQSFHQPGRALVWDKGVALEKPGFVDYELPTKAIADNMVEIETRAFSVDPPNSLGGRDEDVVMYEAAGVVTRLGQYALTNGLQVGDAVCGVVRGPFASRAQTAWTSIAKIPDGLSFSDAASVPMAYAAAYHALVRVARLQKGESVLILHPVDSQDMRAALAVARHTGAYLFFAAATEAEAQLLVDRYHVPTDHVLLSRGGSSNITAAVMEKTNSKGVNVVMAGPTIPASSASLLRSACGSVARFGRLVEIGCGGLGKGVNLAALAARCATYACVDVLQLAEHDDQAMKEGLETSLRILSDGYLPPATVTQFPASHLDRALRHIRQQQRQGGHAGKVIIAPQYGESVKVLPRAQPPPLEDGNATYLVVGGVSGLGGAIALWMASRGAKNVVVLSRNARGHRQAAAVAEEAAAKGCRLQFLDGDVSTEESLVALLAQISATLPPIRGVVHAASVLDVSAIVSQKIGMLADILT